MQPVGAQLQACLHGVLPPLHLTPPCTAAWLPLAGEARRAEALAAILAKQAGAAASIKEAAERRRAAEAERLAQLADKQRRKQEAQVGCSLPMREGSTMDWLSERWLEGTEAPCTGSASNHYPAPDAICAAGICCH